MNWEQTFVALFSNLKTKRHLCLGISLLIFLTIALPFIAISNNGNNRDIDGIMQEMEILKLEIFRRNTEPTSSTAATNAVTQEHLMSKRRQRRDVGKQRDFASKSITPGGAVYIRWGRTTCPDNYTELVYHGIGGGSWHGHTGAATNLQCLPDKPDWGQFNDAAGGAFIYGIEYQDAMSGIMSMSNVENSLVNHNVPCAVCRSSIRASVLMIPAKNVCVAGWHLEYHGYLMAGHHTSNSGTNYICVDDSPEADPAGYRDDDGALLYRVSVQCGSLPCPRYVQNRELTCVVCTK